MNTKTKESALFALGVAICAGVAAMFIFQAFENIGMCIGIMPCTGIPLPFFSYGGTAIMVLVAEMGIVLNVSRQSTKKRVLRK